MKKYRCVVCEWIYDPAVGDPDGGIAPGTPSEEIPDDRTCPVCGVGQEQFRRGRREPESEAHPGKGAPRGISESRFKKIGGGYTISADFCYFCPSRTVRG